MYIELFGSSDRIGGNIVDMISQIVYAVHNKMYIRYNRDRLRVYNSYNQTYNSSVFMQTLFDIIDKHNETISDETFTEQLDLAAPSHFEVWVKTLLNIEQDLFSYFRDHIYTYDIKEKFVSKGIDKNYEVPFHPKKTILVHLRLEDVRSQPDYDGTFCTNYFKERIENGIIPNNNLNEEIHKIDPNCNRQAPIAFDKLQKVIDSVLKDKPNHEVILVTNPNEDTSALPYKCIASDDECLDLFLLCNCETVILSRSNFALISLFFGFIKEAHIPLWGHLPCYGLCTKYDKNNFKYFT